MSEPASEVAISELLQQLNSADAHTRAEAVRQLGGAGSRDPAVIRALDRLRSYDNNEAVRAAARTALGTLRPGEAGRRFDFAIGFIGWWVVNGLIFIVVTNAMQMFDLLGPWLAWLPWIVNIAGIVYFAFTRPQIAKGALAAFGVAFAIVLLLGVLVAVVCFVLPGLQH